MPRFLGMGLATGLLVGALIGEVAAEDQFFDSEGVRIRYIEQGSGEPVVLLHGNPTSIEVNWRETGVIEGLAENFRVIALDLRGFGQSDKSHDPSDYGANMAGDVIRLMDHLNIEQAHIVGYSMGARITSWLMVNYPERLITVNLAASTYWVDSPELRESFEAAAMRWESDAPYDRAALLRENPGMTNEEMEGFIARRVAMNDPAAIAAVYRGSESLPRRNSSN